MNLALWYMREGLDKEGQDTLQVELEKAARLRHPIHEFFRIFAPKPETPVVPKKRTMHGWVKPEGWTPPGWKDDSTAYREAMSVASHLRRQ